MTTPTRVKRRMARHAPRAAPRASAPHSAVPPVPDEFNPCPPGLVVGVTNIRVAVAVLGQEIVGQEVGVATLGIGHAGQLFEDIVGQSL